ILGFGLGKLKVRGYALRSPHSPSPSLPKGERGTKPRRTLSPSFSLLSLWERRAGVVRASERIPLDKRNRKLGLRLPPEISQRVVHAAPRLPAESAQAAGVPGEIRNVVGTSRERSLLDDRRDARDFEQATEGFAHLHALPAGEVVGHPGASLLRQQVVGGGAVVDVDEIAARREIADRERRFLLATPDRGELGGPGGQREAGGLAR